MSEITIVDKPSPTEPKQAIYELLTDGVSKVWYRVNNTYNSHWTIEEIKEWADHHGFEFEGYYE